jgi:hypothetical protein
LSLWQLSPSEVYDQVKVWDINDGRGWKVHQRIGEIMNLDKQPFSIVEDNGFVRLVNILEPRYKLPSRKYLVETVLPKMKAGFHVEVN